VRHTLISLTQELNSRNVSDTIHIFRTLGNTARVFKNAVSIEVVRLEQRPEGADFNKDLKHLVSGARGKKVRLTLRLYQLFRRFCILIANYCIGWTNLSNHMQVYEIGDVDAGIWSAGTAVGLIKDVPTCEELLRRIEREAGAIIDSLVQLKSSSAKAKL
jgi:NAD(P)H-dependent flavin oxidoreductase YrpB (nitropropane dioxygenase family)